MFDMFVNHIYQLFSLDSYILDLEVLEVSDIFCVTTYHDFEYVLGRKQIV